MCEAEAWSTLSTVTNFDAGSTAVVGTGDSGLALRDGKQTSPVSLLIESLVEQLCRLLSHSPRQQKKLYNVICRKLHQMNLIDQTYSVEEFDFMRSHYQRALFHLLNVAKTVTGESAAINLPRYRLAASELLLSSRYRTEFEEVEFIARGGFGRVYKARNKLDGMEYAVKKISLQYHNVSNFMRNLHEVKMLARLNHPNIVSYKAAWLEPLPSSPRQEMRSSDDDSGSIVFAENSDTGEAQCQEMNTSTTVTDDSDEKAVCHYQPVSTSHVYESAMLYVQMQLCERTLRQWLDEKNACVPARMDIMQSAAIFQQVVQGICYIHSQNIVHHDIKPSNIFINAGLTQVQVGDFGLACCLQHSADDVMLLSEDIRHRGEVGTRLYAAPEQMRGRCHSKSDVFSLGIVLFELLQPFTTEMERCKVIAQLRAGHIPPELHVLAPKWAQLISELTKPLPSLRPTADELNKMLVPLMESTQDKNETIQQLLAVISQRDHEIEELRRRLQALETNQ